MIEKQEPFNSTEIYGNETLNLDSGQTSQDNKTNISLEFNIPPILKESSFPNTHYLCPKCHFFPKIQFVKDEPKVILYTCLDRKNGEKVLIKDLFDPQKEYLTFIDNNNGNNNNINENDFKCNLHENFNKLHKYKYYCKNCQTNLCKLCCQKHVKNNHDLINFDFLNAETSEEANKIIEYLNKKKNKDINENESYKIEVNNSYANIIEQDKYNIDELIILIINDYLKYPHYSHFSNIENICYFLKIKDIKEEQKDYINKKGFQDHHEMQIIITNEREYQTRKEIKNLDNLEFVNKKELLKHEESLERIKNEFHENKMLEQQRERNKNNFEKAQNELSNKLKRIQMKKT